jgi:hypothetical protein
MSDWNVTVLRRQAGLEPGFHGADEPLDEFQTRLAADDELVRGLVVPSLAQSPDADTWAPPSYLPGPELVHPSAASPALVPPVVATAPTPPVAPARRSRAKAVAARKAPTARKRK